MYPVYRSSFNRENKSGRNSWYFLHFDKVLTKIVGEYNALTVWRNV
jgi:hypothetical protein